MKKLILVVALCIGQLVNFAQPHHTQKLGAKVEYKNSQSGSIRLQANVFGIQYKEHTIQSKVYKSIHMPDMAPMLITGAPDLQQIASSVIIPDLQNMDIKIVNAQYTEYANIDIAPSKGNLTRDVDPHNVAFQFSKVYNKDAFFPGKLADLRSPYIFRDHRAQTVVFYPFQYNPVTKVLRVYHSIDVELTPAVSSTVENPFYRTATNQKTPVEFAYLYQHQFANYTPQKYTPVTESGTLLIIADSAYMNAMKPYVDWKIRTGRKTEMVSKQSIGTTAAQIKAYISNYYTTKGLAYVLLVGDHANVPTHSLSGGHSDNYHGYLTGNDSYPEVIIGRFSAESVAHVQAQVSRTIEYEMSPGGNNGSYTRSLGLSSNQGPGDDNEYDYDHIRNMQLDLDSFTYHYQAELFDGSQGGNDAPGDPSASDVANELNNGTGLVLYTGHGSSSSFVSSGFNNSHITSLNNMGKLPFIWSVACVNGDFVNKTCFAEYWLRSTNSGGGNIGAVAVLMSTINQSWDPPMEGQDEMVDVLVESYQNNIKRTFGGLSMSGCMKMNDTYGTQGDDMTDTWTIFGDPTLMVRTDTPKVLTVNHVNTLSIGANQLAVNVNVDDALVALTNGDSIYGTAISSNGIANLSFGAISAVDTFRITVTAFNHIPYLANIMSISANAPFVSSVRYYLNDSLSNNNREAENGESVKLAVCLQNSGLIGTSGVTAKLRTNSAFITLSDSVQTYGAFASGDSIMKSSAFAFSVASQVLNGTQIPFQVYITDGTGNSWTSYLNVKVNAPVLEVINNSFTEVSGNGDQVPDAGETINVKFELKNIGKNDIQNVVSSISSASSYVTINTASITINQLMQDSVYECLFDVDLSASIPDGERIELEFDAANGVFVASDEVSFRVGVVDEDFETGDFTQFYWVLSGQKNWVTDNTTKIEGNYSAKSGLLATDDNKKSVMSLGINVKTADTLSFYAKISCEDGSAYGQWYDFLEFEIDGVRKDRWQGEVDWQRYAFPIDTGQHVLAWTYSKDSYMSEGSDCAWIDYIVFPPLKSTVGVENQTVELEAKVYPNPSVDIVKVEFVLQQQESLKIQLYAQDGKLLRTVSNSIYMDGTHSQDISVEGLDSGVYYVVVIVDGQRMTYPIIKL
jgi:hypothetical protein